jgi:molybdenum cofactor cytidylyltransferase
VTPLRLGAVVLAAGKGTRFGGGKLAAKVGDKTLLERVIETARASPAGEIVVVTRPGVALPKADDRVRGCEIESEMLSDSLRLGLARLVAADAALIFLGDMPLVPPKVGQTLVDALGEAIAAVPTFDGRPGNPVLLARGGFALAEELSGDSGLGRVLRERHDVVYVPVSDDGVLIDVDTADDLAAVALRIAGS